MPKKNSAKLELVAKPATSAKPTVPGVVEALERALAMARTGEVIGIGIALVHDDYRIGTSSGSRTDPITINLLRGAIADLQHEAAHAIRGK